MYLPLVTFDFTMRNMRFAVAAGILATAAMAGIAETASSQPLDSKDADTSVTQRGPLPQFYLVSGWEATVEQAEPASTLAPLVYAIERLCIFHNAHFDPQSAWIENRSPLEWPDVFANSIPNASRQRTEARALLESNGLSYRELIPLDLTPRALADSLAIAIVADEPVLINAPGAPVVYGYDRREPDHWWWFDVGGTPEIEMESGRTSRITMWSDDPATGVAWIATGTGDYFPRNADSVLWAFLSRLNRSVQGVPEEGIAPYPLSLRHFRDMLASPESVTLSEAARISNDPLGILQARSARESVLEALQSVSATVSDTLQNGPLRLTEYHMHGSVATLQELAVLVYGEPFVASGAAGGGFKLDNLQTRTRALQLVTELLKSEKLAMESLAIALDAHAKATEKPVPPHQKRRGR